MRISLAMAAEWVMPEQPRVSTRASSIDAVLDVQGELAGALLGSAPAHTVGEDR